MKIANKTSIFIFALVALFWIPAHSEGLAKGNSFLAARQFLIKHGWHPVVSHKSHGDASIGVENVLIKSHILEVETCAIDKALCIFNYVKGNRCLRVIAQGEAISDMYINSWKDSCADKN